MKIITFSAYLSAIASASASSFQAQRLRGNQEARELEEQQCVLERSTIADSKCARKPTEDVPNPDQAFRPTNYTAGFAIDGTVANWGDLSCGIPMWEAGNPEKTLASHAFLNWDCSTSELCILVKAVDGFSLVDQFWFKDYSVRNSDQTPIEGKEVRTILNDGGIEAWEACYSMAAVCSDEVEIHANFDITGGAGGRTTSTGKTKSLGSIALDLTCPCEEKVDCEINACYEPSTCVEVDGIDSTTTSICEYSVYSVDSEICCIGEEDCEDDLTCFKQADDANKTTRGTCQTKPPTPAPVAGGGNPSATPAPNVAITNACTSTSKDDCTISDDAHDQCAAPICNELESGNTCGTTAARQGESCDKTADVKDVNNTCYSPLCSGVSCVDAYKAAGQGCKRPDNDPYGSNFECVDYKCLADPEDSSSTRTTCKADPKSNVTACNRDIFPRGECDKGDKCDGKGMCSSTYSYMPSNTTCRKSKEGKLCDAPEYCTGDNYTCPEDKNYGDDGVLGEDGAELIEASVCRPVCESDGCKDDIEEVCPGNTDTCPDDVIFERVLDLIAGQHFTAGSVVVNATDDGDGSTEVCVTIYLDDAWELQSTDEPIKMEINTEGGIRSSPGSYTYKDLVVGEKSCNTFSNNATTPTVYFAVHVDVQKVGEEGSAETAWAKAGSTSTETSLTPHPFIGEGTKSGPKVKVNTKGWGEYHTFSINCANIKEESCTPTGGGGSGGGTTTPANYTCTNGTDSAVLTCQHKSDVEGIGCHNLFG
eukprot:scaffold4904_cov113-Skeletonema_dohrnii-CCMP3373.AAC.4